MTNQKLVILAVAASLACAAAEVPRVLAFTNRVESFTNTAGAAFKSVRLIQSSADGLTFSRTNGAAKERLSLLDIPEAERTRIGVPAEHHARAVENYNDQRRMLGAATNGSAVEIVTIDERKVEALRQSIDARLRAIDEYQAREQEDAEARRLRRLLLKASGAR